MSRPKRPSVGWLVVTALLSLPSGASTFESTPEAVRTGHWLKVRGEVSQGVLVASRVELVEPRRHEELIATAAAAPAGVGEFLMLGQPVQVSDKTEWRGVKLSKVVGQRIKVEGHFRSARRFSAREISPRGSGRDRIVGRVDSITSSIEGIRVRIMSHTVLLPRGVNVEHDTPLENLALSRAPTEVHAQIMKGEEDLFGQGVALSDKVRFNAQIELRSTSEENLDLDDQDPEDRVDYNGSVRARLEWQPGERFSAVGELRSVHGYRDDQADGTSTVEDTRVGETFLLWRRISGTDLELQVGRQDFDEQREWLYDQNLDGLRLVYSGRGARLELSATTSLSDARRRDLEASNYIAYLSNRNPRRHLALYAIHREFDLEFRERTTHVGLRALGRWLPRQKSWLELAFLQGELKGSDVEAWAADLGTTWSSKSPRPVWFTFGYARGSGDSDLADDVDRTFRQTGLQDNNDKFGGVTSFRYYGELVEPELANLEILTVGVGKRLARRTSIDLVLHHYRQLEPRNRLYDTQLEQRPTGLDPDIGLELDAVFGWRRLAQWDLEVVAAYFVPGDAFRRPDDALLAKVQLRYRF